MDRTWESKAWRSKATDLLRRARSAGLPARMERHARALVGRPYLPAPLVGSPARAERLIIHLDGFDCVTFVESVLALARGRTLEGFARELIATRYTDGQVAWDQRLHYFSDWLRANQRRGAIRIRTRGAGSRSIRTGLSVVAGLPERRTRFHVVPKAQLERARRRLTSGSIVAFASTRSGLDFFHTGLVFGDDPGGRVAGLTLIHAARSAGRVVAEPLGDFLCRNRMRGLAFAAPVEPTTHRGGRP